MFIVSVIKGNIQKGETQEVIYEAETHKDAMSCQEFWDAHPDTVYTEIYSEHDLRPSMENAVLGS